MNHMITGKLKNIAEKYQIADIYTFGSRQDDVLAFIRGEVTGLKKGGSDLDIGVRSERDVRWSIEDKVEMTMDFEDIFKVNNIDLVILNEAEPYLALEIIKGELLYTNDPDEQARYELYVMRRAGDLLQFKRQRIRMILENGAR